MPGRQRHPTPVRRHAAALLLVGLCLASVPRAASGPGLGNLLYGADEVWTPISVIRSPEGHGKVFMSDGYLNVIWDRDGGGAPDVGGLDVWDVSDPRHPVKVKTYDNAETHRFREPHALGLWNRGGQIILVAQSHTGVVLFDVTDVDRELPLLGELAVPGIATSDYGGPWWVALQAPHVYVAAVGQGLFVADISDPTQPRLVNQLPTGALGGKNPGSVFAVGNLLVLAEPQNRGYTTMDISDPAHPLLLESIDGRAGYTHLFTSGYLLSSGGADDPSRMYAHRIGHDGRVSYAGEAGAGLGNGGYGSYQDGFLFSGFSTRVAKFRVDPPSMVGSATSGFVGRDEDFGQVLGNLIWVGDDHGVGSVLVPHRREPDATGAEVEWIHPADGASGLALTTRIGVSLSDQVAIAALTPDRFVVRAAGGAPITGQLSASLNTVNFAPDTPLAARTSYEVTICGVRDLVGNAGGCFTSVFTTGDGAAGRPTPIGAPTCAIGPFAPVEGPTPSMT